MNKILTLFLILMLPIVLLSQVMVVHTTEGQEEYEMSKVDSVTFGSKVGQLTWFGQASLKIKTNDGMVFYVDPYAGTNDDYAEPADYIFVTHGHGDHNAVNKVTQGDNCKIYCGAGAAAAGRTTMSVGDVVELDGLKVTAVEAYNGNHPKGTGVGFVFEINGVKIYHCGDTDKIDEMAALADMNLDYSFLCIDGKYNMGPEMAMEVAEIINSKKVTPFHTGFSAAEKENNLNVFKPKGLLPMDEGDTIHL